MAPLEDMGPRRTAVAQVAATALLFAVGCSDSDSGIIRVQGSGFFEPAELDFGSRGVGDIHDLVTVLHNASANDLPIQDVRFDPPTDGHTRSGWWGLKGEKACLVRIIFW